MNTNGQSRSIRDEYPLPTREKLNELLETMIAALRNNPKAYVGTILQEFRETAGLTQAALAERIAVHENTIRRWENDEKHSPPLGKILLLSTVFDVAKAQSPSQLEPDEYGDLCIVGGTRIAVRSVDYILDQEKLAQKVWVLRSDTAFFSGHPGAARTLMLELLETTSIEYRFLFMATGPDAPIAALGIDKARTSHENFIRAVVRREQELRSPGGNIGNARRTDLRRRVRGWPLDQKDCLALGVGSLYASSVLIEYKAEEVVEHGQFNIFIEIPVATYDPHRPDLLGETSIKAWVQLWPERASEVYNVWRDIFDKYEGHVDEASGRYDGGRPHHTLSGGI